ncbi:hypothetical protein ACFU8I_00555 [Streptomyces sp. NPDC057540]|uniref:hypothetical protein n=1 Tax=Streptomyces sp. NPDC057540 TaxID=3346160 RepID=UPI0036B736C2
MTLSHPTTAETVPALLATIQELHALQQPLVGALQRIHEDMENARSGGDEWASEWTVQVWNELPLAVRAAGGDQDAAQELADAARTAAARQTTGQDDSEAAIVAYRSVYAPGLLFCLAHNQGWPGFTPLTSDDLPDGGICTWGPNDGPKCGRDVLIDEPLPAPAVGQPAEAGATDRSDTEFAQSVVADLRTHLTPEEQLLLSPIAAALYEHNAVPRGWPEAHPHDVICYTNDAYIALMEIRSATATLTHAVGQSAEAQADEVRWRVQHFDPLAQEWTPGVPLSTREHALERLQYAREKAPRWADDGTPVDRRVVRETTTWTVEDESR